MRAFVVRSTALLPLILLCASAGQSSPDQILGRWRSMETSMGGIGVMFEFHAGGVVDYSPGAVVETPWRKEDGQLVLPSGTVGGLEQPSSIGLFGFERNFADKSKTCRLAVK
jgi:hypothetical protein